MSTTSLDSDKKESIDLVPKHNFGIADNFAETYKLDVYRKDGLITRVELFSPKEIDGIPSYSTMMEVAHALKAMVDQKMLAEYKRISESDAMKMVGKFLQDDHGRIHDQDGRYFSTPEEFFKASGQMNFDQVQRLQPTYNPQRLHLSNY